MASQPEETDAKGVTGQVRFVRGDDHSDNSLAHEAPDSEKRRNSGL